MFCKNCGKELDSSYNACPYCGTPVNGDLYNNKIKNREKGNIGWAVLGFFIPLAGLILYLVWKDDRPGDSRMAGKGALISVIIGAVISIISIIISIIATSMIM